MHEQRTTRITHISWGCMKVSVDGRIYEFKDCKVWPDGAKVWDWGRTGTSHQTGIQPADIEEILDRDVEGIVLSRGMQSRLHTSYEAEDMMKSRGVEHHIEEARKAAEKFNQFAEEGRRVGGIFHSTC